MEKFLHYQFTKEQLIAEVGKKENHFLLAYINDVVAGYIKLKDATHKGLGTDNAVEISRFYARKEYIGKGVGKALMETALEYASKNSKAWIWLVVWKQNHRAIRFYESFGYRIFAEASFVLGDDIQHDWVMKREVQLSV
jgi:diamine N-acetyltransferase